MLKSLLSLLLTTTIFAAEFESVNYYSKNYLFDAQIYSVNTFVSENTLSHQLGDFTPHLNYIQYQGLDQYKESDFGPEETLCFSLNSFAGDWISKVLLEVVDDGNNRWSFVKDRGYPSSIL